MNSLHTGIVVNMESSQICFGILQTTGSPQTRCLWYWRDALFSYHILCWHLCFLFVFRCRWDNGLKMSRINSLLPPLSVLALFLPVCLSVQKAGQSSMWSQVCMQISDKLQVHPKTHFQCILNSISLKFEPYELFRKVSKGLYMIWA